MGLAVGPFGVLRSESEELEVHSVSEVFLKNLEMSVCLLDLGFSCLVDSKRKLEVVLEEGVGLLWSWQSALTSRSLMFVGFL